MINETERNEWVDLCNAIEMNLDDYAERAMAHCDMVASAAPDNRPKTGDFFTLDEIRTLASAAMTLRKVSFILMQSPPDDPQDIVIWLMAQQQCHESSNAIITTAINLGMHKGLIEPPKGEKK